MATADGAAALGLADAGTLEPGQRADFVLLDPASGFAAPDGLARRPVRSYRLQHGPVARRRDVRGRRPALPARGAVPAQARGRPEIDAAVAALRGAGASGGDEEEVMAMRRRSPLPSSRRSSSGRIFRSARRAPSRSRVSLAASQGAKVHIVHVLIEPVQAFDVAGRAPLPRRLDAEGMGGGHEEAARARAVASAEKRGVPATSEFLWGRPSDALVETAVRTKASLVVLGTHGRERAREAPHRLHGRARRPPLPGAGPDRPREALSLAGGLSRSGLPRGP